MKEIAKYSDIELQNNLKKTEEEFSTYLNSPYFALTASGLSSLSAALFASNVKEGDEVICDGVFPFAIMAIKSLNAIPIVADIDLESMTISSKSVEDLLTIKTKAIIATAVFGIPPNTKELFKVIKKFPNVKLIEDHAQAFGVKINDKHVSTIPDITCFSFHIDKPLSSGFGGGVVSKTKNIDDKVRRFINLGWYPRVDSLNNVDWDSSWKERSLVCQSARLSPITAMLLSERLKMFAEKSNIHIECVKKIEMELKSSGFLLQTVPDGFNGQRWRIAILLDSNETALELLLNLKKLGSSAYQYNHPVPSEWNNFEFVRNSDIPKTKELLKRLVVFEVMDKKDLKRELKAIRQL